MSNRFRDEIEEEEVLAEEEVQAKPEPKSEIPKNNFTAFFRDGFISKESATNTLPFIIFISVLAMFYIGNRHFAENNIRSIDKLGKEVKELSWDFKTIKAELMLKSTQTEVAKQVDTLGLKVPVEPPKKIVYTNEYTN